MRKAFCDTLLEAARHDDRIFLIVGDVGRGLMDSFAQEFPDRFLNVGVAEQNMAGIAAGLALCGKTVFYYSLPNFATIRCLEQIRNDICYHNASVKIVSGGGGIGLGVWGMTHHGTEDIAVMRSLPNMTVVVPADPVEAALATRYIASTPGPVYLRLTKGRDPIVHHETPDFELGKAITVREGDDVALIATGGMVYNALLAADLLAKDGISARVLSMHTLKPLDTSSICAAAKGTSAIVTVEEHGAIGGLGSAVAEALLAMNQHVAQFVKISIEQPFTSVFGDYEYLLETHGLSVEAIYKRVKSLQGK